MCNLCSDTSHVWCGFCSRCREHCVAYYLCRHCAGFFDDTTCPESPSGKHEFDETSEALSECCGAPGWAYDYDPT